MLNTVFTQVITMDLHDPQYVLPVTFLAPSLLGPWQCSSVLSEGPSG